jgi:NADPH:quinone reductase-like Zn-dependent oxidoreductase
MDGRTLICKKRIVRKKRQELINAGADHVIVTHEEGLVTDVGVMTPEKGARLVLNLIGGRILESLAALTAPKGIIFEYGALVPETTPYPLITALAKRLTISRSSNAGNRL